LFEYLTGCLTDRRHRRLNEVLRQRTRRLAVVLDSVRQRHNVSAVLRSCDAFGIQDVHVIESDIPFEPCGKIAMGSDRWLTITSYTGAHGRQDCIRALRQHGFRLVGTGPPGAAAVVSMDGVDFHRPLAIAFGNEKKGLSRELLSACEATVAIPMFGFVESLNISVAAAVMLQALTRRLRETRDDWGLSLAEQSELLFDWTRKSIRSVDLIEQRWRERRAREGGRDGDPR
jgi:tRNA (guanosine-2'-O-)-methyltransferase